MAVLAMVAEMTLPARASLVWCFGLPRMGRVGGGAVAEPEPEGLACTATCKRADQEGTAPPAWPIRGHVGFGNPSVLGDGGG